MFEDKKVRSLIIVLVLALSVGVILKFFVGVKAPTEATTPEVAVAATDSQEIVVYVTGAVLKPGLVKLPPTARMADALTAAGQAADADIGNLNLAEKLKDGQKIVVPRQASVQAGVANGGVPSANSQAGAAGSSAAAGAVNSAGSSGLAGNPTTKSGQSKVNINTADEKELDTLPGIGPAMAARIIAYRNENGAFTSIEGLKEVSGIGDKKFADLADLITVQ